jgi:hypothetical protein
MIATNTHPMTVKPDVTLRKTETLDDAPDHAAEAITITETDNGIGGYEFWGSRGTDEKWCAEPDMEDVTVDITEALVSDLKDIHNRGEAKFSTRNAEGIVSVSKPHLVVVDADGKPVSAARVLVVYTKVDVEYTD